MKMIIAALLLIACENKPAGTLFCPPVASSPNWGNYMLQCMQRVVKEAEEPHRLYHTRETQCSKEDYKCMTEHCHSQCVNYFCVKVDVDTLCKEHK